MSTCVHACVRSSPDYRENELEHVAQLACVYARFPRLTKAIVLEGSSEWTNETHHRETSVYTFLSYRVVRRLIARFARHRRHLCRHGAK